VAAIVFQVALTVKAGDFASSSDHSRAAVDDVTKSRPHPGVQVLNLPGTLSFAFALVLLSLNAIARRPAHRFMGVLGIICGAALVRPAQNPIIVFWAARARGPLRRRWPQGMPPAWETGRAVAWPSSRRSPNGAPRRAAKRDAARGSSPRPNPDNRPAHSSSKKRKRKRRR